MEHFVAWVVEEERGAEWREVGWGGVGRRKTMIVNISPPDASLARLPLTLSCYVYCKIV